MRNIGEVIVESFYKNRKNSFIINNIVQVISFNGQNPKNNYEYSHIFRGRGGGFLPLNCQCKSLIINRISNCTNFRTKNVSKSNSQISLPPTKSLFFNILQHWHRFLVIYGNLNPLTKQTDVEKLL